MARSAASIQTQITAIESRLASIAAEGQSLGEDGAQAVHPDYFKLTQLLDSLYVELERAQGTNTMFSGGNLSGLGGGC